ncbi:MAG: hypothetical protein AAB729_04715 [Patescibacteria group bacterium]|mgnify:CR=1 FL=1
MNTTKFQLTNLNCSACGKVSQMKISKIKDVISVRLEQDGNTATGELDAGREVQIPELQEVLAGTGYKVHSI